MVTQWLSENWFDLVQTIGLILSFLLTAYVARKDELARQISNMFKVNERHDFIWSKLGEPGLSRIRRSDVDLKAQPVTEQERAFVTMLLLHLDTVRRASRAGLFITLEGLEQDIRQFLSLPIPRAVWDMIKPFQDEDFVELIDKVMAEK